jgi:hypothetical protein
MKDAPISNFLQNITGMKWIYASYRIYKSGVKPKACKMQL